MIEWLNTIAPQWAKETEMHAMKWETPSDLVYLARLRSDPDYRSKLQAKLIDRLAGGILQLRATNACGAANAYTAAAAGVEAVKAEMRANGWELPRNMVGELAGARPRQARDHSGLVDYIRDYLQAAPARQGKAVVVNDELVEQVIWGDNCAILEAATVMLLQPNLTEDKRRNLEILRNQAEDRLEKSGYAAYVTGVIASIESGELAAPGFRLSKAVALTTALLTGATQAQLNELRGAYVVAVTEHLEAKRWATEQAGVSAVYKSLHPHEFMGGQVKALPGGRVAGYLVHFSTANDPDLTGDFFTKSTDLGPVDKVNVYYNHGLDPTLGLKVLGQAKLTKDSVGAWVDAQLNLADEYEKAVYELAQAGRLGWSSGAVSHAVSKRPAGKAKEILSWPIGEASLTPTPAEYRARAAAL